MKDVHDLFGIPNLRDSNDNVVAIGGKSATDFAQYNTANSPIMFPVVEREMAWVSRKGDYHHTGDYKAIIRVDKDGKSPRVLNVVNTTYKLVHNHELFNVVEQAISAQLPLTKIKGVQVTDRVSNYGRMCYREYVFPNFMCDVGGSVKSSVAFRMIVQNGYGGSAIRMHAGAIEFYCTNGMIIGQFESAYRRHTSGLIMDHIDTAVSKACKRFNDAQDTWRKWSVTRVPNEAAMELFRAIASSPRQFEQFSEQYLQERAVRGATVWSVYSTLTFYASHSDGDFKLRDPNGANNAQLMLERELKVARWVETPEFKKLVTV